MASYPGDLQQFLGAAAQVSNFGVVGADMLSSGDIPYVAQVEYTQATAFVSNAGAGSVVNVVVMLGTNDSKPNNWTPSDGGTSAAQFASDYAVMVDYFTSLPTHPVVYLVLPPTAYASPRGISNSVIHDQIIPIINTVATQKAMSVIDVNSLTAGHPEYFVSDGAHPNDGGYQVIAQSIYNALTGLVASAQDAGTDAPDGSVTLPNDASMSEAGALETNGTTQPGRSGACSCRLSGGRGVSGTSAALPFAMAALLLVRLVYSKASRKPQSI